MGSGALLVAVVGGALFGASTVVLNTTDHPLVSGVASVVGAGSGWAAAGLVAGWFAYRATSSLWRTVVLSTVFLLGATVSYYVVDHWYALARYAALPPGLVAELADGSAHGGPPEVSVEGIVLWSAVALVCGPVCGLVGALARRPGTVGLLARLSLPVGLAAWSGYLLSAPAVQVDPVYVIAQAVTACVSAGLAAVLVVRHLGLRGGSRKTPTQP